MSEQAGRYPRSFPGMVGAMIVLVAAVLAFVGFRSLVRGDVADPAAAVDYQEPLDYARQSAGLEVVAPDPLPDGWKATSVRFTPAPEEQWHLGMLTDGDEYAGLEQADRPESSMVEDFVDEDATSGDPVTVAGERWRSWTDDGGDTAWVRRARGTTTLVVTSGSERDLVALVESLR